MTWGLWESVARSGQTHVEGAPIEQAPGTSKLLKDDGQLLAPDQMERELLGGVRVSRTADGGLSLRNGNLREVLAAADTDLRVRLKAAKGTAED